MYFLKTHKNSKGELKMIALPGQTDHAGNPIDTTLNISCDKELRLAFDEGTVFFCNTLKLSSSGKFYTVTGGYSRLSKETLETIRDEYNTLTGTFFIDPLYEPTVYDVISSDPALKVPTSKDDGFYMSSKDWRILVRNIKRQVNTMILGPTGSGKTSCVREVCDRVGLPLHVFDMGSMIDPISSLLGVHRLEEGQSVFDMAKFTQVIQEPCVILLDELNRSSIASNNVLFPCLDDRRELSVEIAGSKDIRSIKVHPEVTFIATANIGSEYTGASVMDRALINRFFPLELGIIPSNEEQEVLMKRTGVDAGTAELIVKVANNIRSLAAKDEVSCSLSIRETLMTAGLIADGWNTGEAMEMVYLPLYEGTVADGERSKINKTISSY